MQIDYLIIGQGISGSWLSYFLYKENKDFLVIDSHAAGAASRLAAGIINPVTGRRYVRVWMDELILPFAVEAYHEFGNFLGVNGISQKNIIDFFPNPETRLSFQQRVQEQAAYISIDPGTATLQDYFNYDFGYGQINPVYTAHLELLLPAWEKYLIEKNGLREEVFNPDELELTGTGIRYRDIRAAKIIFCDGSNTANNPFFSKLPFAPNKGEALILEIPGLPPDHIYKRGMSLVPMFEKDQWWIGSSYEWNFSNLDTSTAFREKTERLLQQWLKIPYRVTGHVAGNRPATIERRPFVGIHPSFPAIGILNGMGTKGCSLAPYFAYELVAQLLHEKPISPEASVARFSRLLSRS